MQEQLDYERAERARERQEAQERERKAETREGNTQATIEKLTETISRQTLLLTDNRTQKPTKRSFWSRIRETT